MRKPDPYRIPSVWRDGFMLIVTTPIYLTARVFYAFFGRDSAARQSREQTPLWEERMSFRNFLLGVPALATACFTTVLCAVNLSQKESDLANSYFERARAAVNLADYDRAVICLTRVNEFRDDDPTFRFQLGLALDAQGRTVEAQGLIGEMAPPDRIGFAPAHLWSIKRRLQNKPDATVLKSIESQLIQLREDPAVGREAAVLLAEVYLRTNRANFVLEEPKLREAAEGEPRLHLLVLQELSRQGDNASVPRRLAELSRIFRNEVERKPDDVDARVRLSQALALSGDLSGAVVTLREALTIHPDGPFGKLLAELLVSLAGSIQQENRLPEAERRATYREAIAAVERFADPSPATELRLGQLYRLVEDYDAAEEHYLSAVSSFPEARLELAELYLASSRPVGAGEQWKRICEELFFQTKAGKPITPTQRRIGGVACLQLGRYQEAAEWLTPVADAPENRTLLLEVYVRWWDSLNILAKPEGSGSPPRLDLLLRALAVDSRNSAVLSRLLAMARRNDRMGEEALTALKGLIAEGNQKAPAYVVLGSAEFTRGNIDVALKYLEQAYRLDPDADVTLNNLAFMLAAAVPPDLDRALKLADAAVEMTNGAARTRDTRFRILARLGRWQAALADVEACEPMFRGSADFHRAAAEVYANLKLSAPAEEHRLRAEELTRIAEERNRRRD